MKILITGASGMVGRNILENNFFLDQTILSPSSSELNLLDNHKVLEYLKENIPDLIIHCAGKVGGIQANIKEPVNFLVQNLLMGINIINSARRLNIKRLINLGSSCMYPRDANNPLKEEDILKGELEPTNEGYALAKVSCARLCQYISREDPSFHYKTLIPCNLYGRWDKFETHNSHMIPAVIRKIHKAKIDNCQSVEIWGDGQARREFMNVKDLTSFIVYTIKNLEKIPSLVNVGLGFDYSILEYYQAIAKVIGFNGQFDFNLNKPVGMKQKLVDTNLTKELGWKSNISIEDGLKETYHFFLNRGKL